MWVELRRGAWTPAQAERLRRLGVPQASSPVESVAVVDLPDPNEFVAAAPEHLVVFDDRETFRGHAAVVIQPSLPAWTGAPGARAELILAGYAYVPVADDIRRRGDARPDSESGGHVAVAFGGSDPSDVAARLAPAVVDLPSRPTVIVIGPDYRGAIDRRSFDVRQDPAGFVEIVGTAALVVASGGTLKYELAVLGRPIILVAVADDQLPVAAAFADAGGARYLGDGRTIEPAAVRAAVVSLLGDEAARIALGERARSLIDGGGAERIADVVADLAGFRSRRGALARRPLTSARTETA
jgi:spore coat polysaccharide biosynthesis predicted glycosyltransferase SpsG